MVSAHTARKLTGLIAAIIVVCTGMIGKPGTGWTQVSYTVLHAFTPPPAYPTGTLVRGSDGAFYGRTQSGGTFNHGIVFKLSADGTELTILHSFPGSEGFFIIGPDGAIPQEGLVQGADGALYGTTYYGGPSNIGTVFKIGTDGTGFTTLHSFTGPDGTIPLAALVQGPQGALYGTTSRGGASDKGTVFKLAADGTGFITLHSFTGSDGASPQGLVLGSDGIVYGTTHDGGASDKGTVFKLAPDGTGFTILHSFTGSDGAAPWAVLIQGADGGLYGTTRYGGASGKGTVFKLAPDGTGFTILHSFTGADGADPLSALAQGSDGAFYGTTLKGGTSAFGTIFKLAADGTEFATLHSFTGIAFDGAYPQVGLVQGFGGALYGTTGNTVFRLAPDGTGFATFYAFTGSEGARPSAALFQGGDGAFYGTTTSGGFSGVGTVFKLGPDGTGFTTLHSFSITDGARPYASLVQGGDGAFYGTTSEGGPSLFGTVFKLAPDGTGFTTLHSFSGPDGARPYAGLVQGGDGLFYGMTWQGGFYDKGTVFRLASDGTGFTILHSFTGIGSDGANPWAGLVEGSDGAFYGTTTSGGFSGVGTVFKVAENGTVFTTLHSFTGAGTDGAKPFAALVHGSDGKLYGTTQGLQPGIRGTDVGVACGTPNEGCASGSVFTLALDGTEFTTLHSFTWPASPLAGLVRGLDGALYGTTFIGGISSYGTAFKLAPDGTGFTTLYSFAGPDGAYPRAGLVQGSDGRFYGTSEAGGPADAGIVFALQLGAMPTLTMKVIRPFSPIQSSFHTGQQLALLATVAPGTAPATADVYVALQLPDGSLRFLQGGGSLTTAVQLFAAHWPVGPFNGQIFSHTFGGWEPTGSYTWLAAFTQPGTLNFIGPIVSAPFSFSP